MVDSVQTWNGQQVLAQNAQYSQAQAQARLGLQEINDQSRMEQQLKQLPQDLSAMQQLEAIQGLALKNGRLDAAEKAAGMIGQLAARTEATVLKTEQAAKAREQTQQSERNDIMDLMSSSTDQRSWDLNRTLALSSHPETAKSMIPLLNTPWSEGLIKQMEGARMTPAQREKAKQEQANAEEQRARKEKLEKEIKELDFMTPLKAALTKAQTTAALARANQETQQAERTKALRIAEERNGGKNVGKVNSDPNSTDLKQAAAQIKSLAPGLDSVSAGRAAVDVAAKAKEIQTSTKGLSWNEALRRATADFQNQLVTTEEGWRKTKTTSYVPRPSDVPEGFKVSSTPVSDTLLQQLRQKSGNPELKASKVTLWVNPENPTDIRADVQQ